MEPCDKKYLLSILVGFIHFVFQFGFSCKNLRKKNIYLQGLLLVYACVLTKNNAEKLF